MSSTIGILKDTNNSQYNLDENIRNALLAQYNTPDKEQNLLNKVALYGDFAIWIGLLSMTLLIWGIYRNSIPQGFVWKCIVDNIIFFVGVACIEYYFFTHIIQKYRPISSESFKVLVYSNFITALQPN